jgi:hypothetical protein
MSPKAQLEPAQPFTTQVEQPRAPRPCSRCGTEPRAGSSGWGKKCIAARMQALRAGRRSSPVNNNTQVGVELVNGASVALTETQRRIDEVRRRLLARRSQETSAR